MQMAVAFVSVLLGAACIIVLAVRFDRSRGVARKRLSAWSALRVLGEAIVAAACLILVLGLCWTYFGIKRHRLPMTAGDFGRYGVIEDARRFVPGTKILKFEAVYMPSRILWLQVPLQHFEWMAVPWPVPETVQAHIEYQRPYHGPEEFDQTYLLACSTKNRRDCVALYQLIGIQICGKEVDADGHGGECGYVYLRGQLIPRNGGAFTGPQPAPQVTPPPQPLTPRPKRQLPPGVLIV